MNMQSAFQLKLQYVEHPSESRDLSAEVCPLCHVCHDFHSFRMPTRSTLRHDLLECRHGVRLDGEQQLEQRDIRHKCCAFDFHERGCGGCRAAIDATVDGCVQYHLGAGPHD